MLKLNLFIAPLDPFLTIEAPSGSDQHSYYEQGYDRTPEDVNSIWHDYQLSHGRYAMLNPIIDHYSLFYGGSNEVNDLDLLATSFDFSNAIFARYGEQNWYQDNTGNSQTYQAEAAPVTNATLANYSLNTTTPSVSQRPGEEPGAIIVIGSIITSSFTPLDLRQIRLNLDQASIQHAGGQVYNDYYASVLSKASGAFILNAKEIEADIWGTSADNEITYVFDGYQIDFTGLDLRNLTNFDFNVIYDLDLPPGYGGYTDRKEDGSGYFSNVNSTSFIQYFQQNGSAGMYWYTIHEIVHNIPAVKAYERQQSSAYLQRTGYSDFTNQQAWSSSAEFDNIEKMTNEVTRAISNDYGYPVVSNPPRGYFPGG